MVAQAVAAFGARARPYLAVMQTALANETDDLARKALDGAIRAISR
jgi:hypothetical protein